MEYSQYLQTKHWQDMRQIKLAKKSSCQICESTKNLNIHHKIYKREPYEHAVIKGIKEAGSILFKERTDDLMVLCASCHRLWHHYYGKTYFRHKYGSKIRRLIRYGCQPDMAFRLSKEQYAYSVVLENLKRMSNLD